ncbi:MAG: hypothetical protein QXJ62_05070 [Nitrososphaeria archaeon]
MSDPFLQERLIEQWLPLTKANLCAEIEAAFRKAWSKYREDFAKVFSIQPTVINVGTPQVQNLHTYWARRPCSHARVLTAAAVLPRGVNWKEFEKIAGFNEISSLAMRRILPILINATPDHELLSRYVKNISDIVVCDPMAGGGSIPLESLRLGFRTVVVEYNPVAYLITKATVEFPAKYADEGMFEIALQEAKQMISWSLEVLGKYYSKEDSMRYVFARGIRCSFCNGLIPFAGISPIITKNERFSNRFLKLEFDKSSKTFTAETTDTQPKTVLRKQRRQADVYLQCPYCEKWFRLRGSQKKGQPAFARWFVEHAKLMESVFELYNPVDSQLTERLLNLHIPLIKEVGSEFRVIYGDINENKRFLESFKDLAGMSMELQGYAPVDFIPLSNDWASSARSLGLSKWYMLYNPRQLLVLSSLSRYVAQRAEKLYSSEGVASKRYMILLSASQRKSSDPEPLPAIERYQGVFFRVVKKYLREGKLKNIDIIIVSDRFGVHRSRAWRNKEL